MKQRVLFALIVLGVQSSAGARELYQTFFSARAMGMGGAYSAVALEGDALFYNPAALGRTSGINWEIMGLNAGVNRPDAYQKFLDFKDSDDLAETIQDNYGERIWIGGAGKSSVTLPYFGFAAFAGATASTYLENPANTTLNINYISDYGFALGGAVPIVPGSTYFGLVAKRFVRTGTNTPIAASTLSNLDTDAISDELRSMGTGYSLDSGLLITVPSPIRPTISFVWKDMGNTEFKHQAGPRAPPTQNQELMVGASLEISAPLIRITPAIDYRYLNRSDEQMGKKIHLGLEVSFLMFDFRAGLHQGYYSLGAGLDMGFMRVDAATYGVELGAYPGQLEDRRYVAQLTIELGLGLPGSSDSAKKGSSRSGGSFTGPGGRRLKQRR